VGINPEFDQKMLKYFRDEIIGLDIKTSELEREQLDNVFKNYIRSYPKKK
jgi:hypothetical protein